MVRVETNAVLRYCEALDEFVKIRVFTDREAAVLMQHARISGKKAYMDLVVNACVIGYTDLVSKAAASQARLEEELFRISTEVNPSLDLRRITVPVPAEETSELHLLDAQPAASAKPEERLRHLEAKLSERIVGQAHAVATVARVLRKALIGLRDPNRPIATILFVGQTGVGKTELAKSVTRVLFDDLSHMLRIDCSEFALPHEYAKLIGAPPGYVGHDQGGLLTEAMRARGRAVVLFDEIEKSDERVHDLLLQITDEGFLTDGKGRRVEFNQALIVLTSNVGAEELEAWRRRAGFDAGRRTMKPAALAAELEEAVRGRFRPEFVNRLTELVVFQALGLEECSQIAALFLRDVQEHARAVPLEIRFEPEVPRLLAEHGYRPEYGAREIRRTVEREVTDRISELLVDGSLRRGDTVWLRVRQDRLDITRN